MRMLRPVVLVATLVLVAAACGSADDESGAGKDAAAVAAASEEAPETTTAGSSDEEPDSENVTTSILGQTGTTFVPALDGPFSTEGGATSGNDEKATVSVDGVKPPQLAQLEWPTEWSRTTIDGGDLIAGLGGSDPRDGIPPIDRPRFETVASSAGWIADGEPGALVQIDGEARFYPLSMLTRHEIVNDTFGDVPVSVTFCPLCNTAVTFDRRVDGEELRFGVSGLLRNSDLVMWDDKTTSLWQQITGEAIIGTYAGTKLVTYPTAIVSFGDFAAGFPDGKALSPGSERTRYGRNPYAGYSSSTRPFLFADEPDDRFGALSRVVAVTIDDSVKAFPFEFLKHADPVNDEVGGASIAVFWGGETRDALDQDIIAESQIIGSGVAYFAEVDGQVLTFAKAEGDNMFVDDQTGSTWNILGQAVDGELAGRSLTPAPHRNEFWFAFAAFFPDADVYSN